MSLNNSPSQLLPIPANLTPEQLTSAINDRLRRIAPAVATSAAAASTTTTTTTTSGLAQVSVSSSPYTIPAGVDVVTFQAGASVATLPALAGLTRKPLWLINASGSSVTLNLPGSDTLESKTSVTLYAGARYQLMPNA